MSTESKASKAGPGSRKLRITLRRSGIGAPEDQKATIKALGISKLNQTVVHEDTPQVRGMIRKIGHLLDVDEISK